MNYLIVKAILLLAVVLRHARNETEGQTEGRRRAGKGNETENGRGKRKERERERNRERRNMSTWGGTEIQSPTQPIHRDSAFS